MQIPLVLSWRSMVLFEYKLLLGKWTVKMTQKKVERLNFMVSFDLWSVYRKTNEVEITISKLYFWISLSEIIQENKLWNMLQIKPSAKINPDNENLGGWFNWRNDILRFEANSLVGRTENFRGLKAILPAPFA